MKLLMFTADNAARFYSHGKDTTIRAEGKSKRPRFQTGETVSLRIWTGKAYRSPTSEFGRATIGGVDAVKLAGDLDGGSAEVRVWPGSFEVSPTSARLQWIRGKIDRSESDCERIARRDGFSSWEELVKALAAHHGAPLRFQGFRYCFERIVLMRAGK